MSTVAGRYRATYDRPAARRVLKSTVSTAGMWSKSVLTYPGLDLAGDYVEPSGLDFHLHRVDPSIDLEHGRTGVRGMPVAWARESLAKPGAPYAVEYKSLNLGGHGEPDNFQSLPVGTSYFDKSCRVSSQVFALVEQDALPAVSLEFKAVPGFYKSLGPSPLEPRSAYHFAKADVIRWTVCAQGVCPGALTLTKALPQVPRGLARIMADRRVNVGGTYEPLHGVILKALSAYLPAPSTRTTVRVEKSMDEFDDTGDDLDTAADTMVDDQMPEEPDGDEGAPASNGVAALYSHAQMILDACDQLEGDLENTDSPELYREGQKLCELARSVAEKVKAAGDKHDAKLSSLKGGGDEPEPEEEPADDAPEPDMSTDEDGVMKAIRPVYRKAIKRFKLADLSVQPEPAPAGPSAEFKKTYAELRKWKRLAGK